MPPRSRRHADHDLADRCRWADLRGCPGLRHRFRLSGAGCGGKRHRRCDDGRPRAWRRHHRTRAAVALQGCGQPRPATAQSRFFHLDPHRRYRQRLCAVAFRRADRRGEGFPGSHDRQAAERRPHATDGRPRKPSGPDRYAREGGHQRAHRHDRHRRGCSGIAGRRQLRHAHRPGQREPADHPARTLLQRRDGGAGPDRHHGAEDRRPGRGPRRPGSEEPWSPASTTSA